MPFWSKKHKKDKNGNKPSSSNGVPSAQQQFPAGMADNPIPQPQKLAYTFYCQLAHGSPTGIISGFTNVKELYAKIAKCYEIDPQEILFCTLNTHRLDMNYLLVGQLGLDDFIFAHVKGQRKELEVSKSEDSLGLTITDNGAGYAFIKRIREGCLTQSLGEGAIEVGDHIEKINDESFVNKRHFDVAKALKSIPVGMPFKLRLISPEKTPFANLAPRTGGRSGAGVSSGKKTIRLKAGQIAREEDLPTDTQEHAITEINRILNTILGVDDKELAQCIWDLGREKTNPHDFQVALEADMGEFGFSQETIFDFWGCIGDAKAGRLVSKR